MHSSPVFNSNKKSTSAISCKHVGGILQLGLRKPKNLIINKCVSKLGDLKPVLLATCLARLHPCLTEISLMRMGGELHEMRRKHLSDFRSTDNTQSLELRMQLAQGLAHAEKSWRMRLIGVIGEGQLVYKKLKSSCEC